MNKADTENTQEVFKALNHELMQATFVVMVPDEYDAHGHISEKNEIRQACHNFNMFCRQPNLYHVQDTNSFSIVESYISPVDMIIENRKIAKGTWLATIQSHSADLWNDIKSGEINGVSISALARLQDVEE